MMTLQQLLAILAYDAYNRWLEPDTPGLSSDLKTGVGPVKIIDTLEGPSGFLRLPMKFLRAVTGIQQVIK